MRRISPGRDALEYGLLMTLFSAYTIGYGALCYLRLTPDENGNKRKFGVDLNKPLIMDGAFEEVQREFERAMGRRPPQLNGTNPGPTNNGGVRADNNNNNNNNNNS
eukprot:CAMPEP_0118695430 /NCGR_PEP_ID=MMETSP0800-20121206/13176_1 /TAXON_ID=210618 ORGANISM="Striatella unipunctata, Strain CCMP2910" /NCGR_SAMPLE_ID=MMETSP0800 /ASSEMBLY_ACC=CAM_ASM_000638 /LENGTH=105 /DNA_ID=CAMNT_0006594209 /DNA_START=60 /DNA_END=377 /DNA_ORIENTATION=+